MHFKTSSAIFFNLDQSKILLSGIALNTKTVSLCTALYHTNCNLPMEEVSRTSIFSFSNSLTLFPNKPCFLSVCSTGPLKTLWEKDKSLIMSNFSFSHSVFYRLENFLSFSSSLKLLSANSFSLEESKICCLGKG